MVDNPEDHIMFFVNSGADLINIQSEACVHGDRLINMIKENNKLAGITINPATPISFIKHYLGIVDLVLVMSVNPGYGGQKCIPYIFDKIKELKRIKEENNYKFMIEIDGGIFLNNVKKALDAGVDIVVTGSSFFNGNQKDRKEFIDIVHNYK